MATEIERKYLLDGLPCRASDGQRVLIEQGWVGRLRLRSRHLYGDRAMRDAAHYACVKFGRDLVRREYELGIPQLVFDALWPFTDGHRIRKIRHAVEDGGLVWELDVFIDRVPALVLGEVELPSSDYPVELPAWLEPHVVREVTGEAQYVNLNLAK